MGKPRFDVLAYLSNAQNELNFVVHIVREGRNHKRQVPTEQGRIGFAKNHGFVGDGVPQFGCMGSVVASNAQNFHRMDSRMAVSAFLV
jgi:hypothetical protein